MTDREIEQTIKDNKLLVFSFLSKHNLLNNPDMESAALWGLAKAAESYDPERGYAFSTYAVTCIRNQVFSEYRRINKQNKLVEISYDECVESTNYDGMGTPTAPVETISAVRDVALTYEDATNYKNLTAVLNNILNELEPSSIRYKVYATWYSSDFTYTQSNLADICGVSQPHISRTLQWLKGYIKKRIREENL